ncbi:MAG: TetR/AcrR family transcriptional regulator [Actinobacteria bacterium]|nr:TetR/AcrR family transcriptional regulator [Actinomycetota bacterium]
MFQERREPARPDRGPLDAGPAETKGERTRARLVELAILRFAAEGFRRTSVSDIARDAGLTPAAVYAYFAGKEALFEAAVDTDAAALIDDARSRSTTGGILDREVGFVAALMERVDAHPLARRVLAGLEPDAIHRVVRLPSLDALRQQFAHELAVAQRAGEARSDVDPALMAEGLESIVLALLMAHVQTGEGTEERRAASVVAVLEAALRPPG